MSKAEICNTIILIIQSIILLGQLSLSRKIHNSDISKEKGYFIIEETNHKHFDKDHFRDLFEFDFETIIATVYKGNIIKNLIMDCQSYTKYRPNETTGGIFVSWRRKEELPTGA